jgi:hypothetical protein
MVYDGNYCPTESDLEAAREQTVAETVERCAKLGDGIMDRAITKSTFGPQAWLQQYQLEIRALSPDPHYVELRELKARLEEAKWWQDYVRTEQRVKDSVDRMSDLQRQIEELEKEPKE